MIHLNPKLLFILHEYQTQSLSPEVQYILTEFPLFCAYA